MGRSIVSGLLAAALAVGAAGAAASASTRWVLTDLGTLGGRESEAFAINEAGQIVGWSDNRGFVRLKSRLVAVGSIASAISERGQVIGYSYVDGRQRAFVWTRGTLRRLATPEGNCPASMAAAINGPGHVVGWTGDLDNCSLSISLVRQAQLWQGAKGTALAEIDSEAVGINDRGDVIGNREGATAFLVRQGRLTDLGSLSPAESSYAVAINERAQVVGYSRTASYARRAFLWEKGRMRSLGTLGGMESWVAAESRRGDFNFATFYPDAINERGQVVGTSMTRSGDAHGFLWAKGRIRDLGTLGGKTSRAIAVNERGLVVGTSRLRSGNEHAFVWQAGTLIDLGTLGGKTSYAAAINDRDQIVGAAETRAGKLHAVLWTRSP